MFHRAHYRLWVGALQSSLDISDHPEKLQTPNIVEAWWCCICALDVE